MATFPAGALPVRYSQGYHWPGASGRRPLPPGVEGAAVAHAAVGAVAGIAALIGVQDPGRAGGDLLAGGRDAEADGPAAGPERLGERGPAVVREGSQVSGAGTDRVPGCGQPAGTVGVQVPTAVGAVDRSAVGGRVAGDD